MKNPPRESSASGASTATTAVAATSKTKKLSFRHWSQRNRQRKAHSSRTNSYSSTSSSFRNGSFCSGEPITLFRLELERLQYILHFPEEVAFQLSSTEYQLFYGIAPIDFIRYVGCDLANIPIADNPSPVRNLVKRLSEVSSWITHVIISQPTHDDRKSCLEAITRVIDTCWNIGNFNAAVEILMGLKSSKLRPFWLSLKHEERQRYEEFVDILLPNNENAALHPLYLETVQRALRMPQCRVIPFFGTFLRDLYAIVNDLPNVVVIGNSGETEKLKFLSDVNGDDHYSSNIGVGGLLNTDKINLVGLIIDNLETFHNHNKQLMRYVETPPLMVENVIATSGGGNFIDLSQLPQGHTQQQQQQAFSQQQQQQQQQHKKQNKNGNNTAANDGGAVAAGDGGGGKPPLEVKPYEPVQPVAGSSHGVTLIPLNSLRFDLDMMQRLQHGTTVIHYDPDSGRSVLCRLWLDVSCSTVAWHKSYYGGGGPGNARDSRDHRGDAIGVAGKASGNLQNMQQLSEQVGKFAVPTASSSMSPSQPRPAGAACAALDDGFIRTTYIKAIESVDSYDLDIEAIYRRHSVEEMSVPVICWTINFGCMLNDNEFLYFLAPQQIAHYWTVGLLKVVRCIQQMNRNADRRVLWLKKLYLQLYNECERDGNTPPPPSLVVGNVSTTTVSNELRRLGPRPVDALQAFGGRVEKWKNLGVNQSSHHASSHPRPTDSSSLTDGGGAKSRLKQMTIAVTRRVKGGGSRDCSRSQSPQPQSSLVRPPSIRSQLSSQSGPPGPNSPGYLLKPRGGAGGGSSTNVIVSGPIISSGSGGGFTAGGFGSASFGGIVGCGTTTIGVASDVALSDAGDLDSLYTPRSRTPTSSSYGGRSVGGRSIKSWRSRGGETPNSGSISSSGQVSGLHGMSGKEYQEKPVTFPEFLELFRLFSTRMRKDLKDLFNDCVIHCSANSHVAPKRCGAADRDKMSPRLQSRLESLSGPLPPAATAEFIPDDALTRNTAAHLCHLNEKQQKIYNALALASVSSTGGLMDTSRNSALSVAAIRQFFATQQMEHVDEAYVQRLIAEHEPDPLFRSKQLMSFEGFVRYLSDSTNFAFVPEQIEVAPEQLQYPLSYYYISCSHNTYLTGHQLKGESSAEMYRQVLQTGCRCVELDCWDGDDGLPLIYHGHTFTTKISFRQVVDIIKKSAFETSNLPVILSIENHCSLQQQAKMAQMFKTVFGEKLVTNFLFDCDYSDSPRLPTPWQLQNRILVKNKKMTVEPSAGLYYVDKLSTHGGDVTSPLYRKQSRSSYDSSTIDDVDEDDLDEFLDEEDPEETDEVDERTDAGNSPTKGIIPTIKRSSSSRRRSSKESASECYMIDRSNTMVRAGGSPTAAAATTPLKRVTNTAAMDELHKNPLDLKGCSAADDDTFGAVGGGLSLQQQPPIGGGGSATTASSSGMGGSGSVRSGGGNVNPTASSGIGSASTMPAAAAAVAAFAITANSTPRRAAAAIGGRLPGHQIAPELSDLVIYAQAVKFKGFVSHHFDASTSGGGGGGTVASSAVPPPQDAAELRTFSNSFATPKMRSHAPSLLSSGPSPRRQKSSGQISTTDSVKSGAAAGGGGGDDALTQQLSPGGTITLASSGTANSAASTVVTAAAAAVAANVAGGSAQQQQQQLGSGANTSRVPPNASASCYQVSSLTEAAARKLCRKHPAKCAHYTRDHIMRTYPGGMRIDSSNFNPHRLVEFWQCGLQMVALNYQTPDVAMAVNTAMFEQSGNCGYMLKPRALWDQTHPLYGNLGALMVKERVNGGGGPLLGVGSALILQITIISGQYICPGVFTASPFLEVELIGVPADCAKEKSKIIGRNSVNPIWNHSATFRINFVELAFLRLAVCDGAANGRVLSQRVVPVRCLRPGYRHLPLRSPANQPLEQATLFLRSRFEQEEHIYLHDDYMSNHHHPQYYSHAASADYCGAAAGGGASASGGTAFTYNNLNPATESAMMTGGQEPELNYQILKLDPDANIKPLSILRRQIFIIRIVGLFPDETPTIVHAESASTVRSVIQTALINAGKVSESSEDYTLYEESTTMSCSTPSPICGDSASMTGGNDRAADDAAVESPTTTTQRGSVTSPSAAAAGGLKSRELPHNEPIMDAVAAWNGATRRFFLRKRSTDPINRTWITSIIKSGGSGSGSGSSSAAATAAGSSANLHSMSGAAPSTANAAASSSSSALMSSGGSALLRRSYGGGGILHSAIAAPAARGSADSACTTATPKAHSSTQLHGRSLDVAETGGVDYLDPTGIHPRAKSMGETFLVCIHNVSDTHPYAILRTSINNTSRDIIKQLFAKTQQRYDLNENHYVLIEELRDKVACVSEPTTTRHFGGKKVSVDSLATTMSIPTRNKPTQRYRVLDPDENIWKTQSQWPTPGRFLLEHRDRLSRFENRYVNKLLQTPSDSNQSLVVANPHSASTSAQSAAGVAQQQASSASFGMVRDAPRKVSLSNVRSSGLSRRISRFGKSLTLDGGGRGKD